MKKKVKDLAMIYYSPKGYWKGFAAVKRLAAAAGVSTEVALDCLKKQAIWQISLPPPKHIPRPIFDVTVPNKVHRAGGPHDRPGRGRKLYKYALTIVDVASRYKEAEPLATKEAKEVADDLSRIYSRGTLTWPKLLQVDPGREFMGVVNTLLAKHNTKVKRGRVYYYYYYYFSSACSFFFLLFFFLVPNYTSLISSITGYLARLTPMVISGSQHPLKVDYSILKYYTFMGE